MKMHLRMVYFYKKMLFILIILIKDLVSQEQLINKRFVYHDCVYMNR